MLLENLKQYKNPKAKITRMCKEGSIIRFAHGKYETDPQTPGYLLAGSIYGPSYLSFEFALSYYDLIPERVYTFTSATFEKKKKKRYTNHFGTYTYRDIPSAAYPAGIRIVREGEYYYQIASAEKALCDQLYKLPPVSNRKELLELLFEDQRIDTDEFEKLDTTQLLRIAPLYHCTNLKLLNAWIRKKCMTDFMTSVRSLIVFNLCLKKFEIISILFHRDCRLRLPPVLTSGQPLPETV